MHQSKEENTFLGENFVWCGEERYVQNSIKTDCKSNLATATLEKAVATGGSFSYRLVAALISLILHVRFSRKFDAAVAGRCRLCVLYGQWLLFFLLLETEPFHAKGLRTSATCGSNEAPHHQEAPHHHQETQKEKKNELTGGAGGRRNARQHDSDDIPSHPHTVKYHAVC